jgi:multidrug efflux pump subunit AcrA (membrane-fusion protein)
VRRSAGTLDDALAAERAARAARLAAQARLEAARATLAQREAVEQGIRTAGGAIDAYQVGQIPHDPRLGDLDRNPFEAVGAVVAMDVTGLLDGPGDPVLSEGAARGAAISPEPIGPR